MELKLYAACSFVQVELTNLLDAVHGTETRMVELSALNHLMSTHVLQQAQQIELLYEQVKFDIFLSILFVSITSLSSGSVQTNTCGNCSGGVGLFGYLLFQRGLQSTLSYRSSGGILTFF